VAVRIRMKKFGRRHRPFYRICAMDARAPRDGRVLEELGTYDPIVPETDARVMLNCERVAHWLGVGAQPTDKVRVLIEKYGPEGTHRAQQQAAMDRMAQTRQAPPSRLQPQPEAVAEEAAAPEQPAAEAEQPAAAEAEAATEAAEQPAEE